MATYIVDMGDGTERWVNAGSHREAAALALEGHDGPAPDRLAVLGPDDREPLYVPAAVRAAG